MAKDILMLRLWVISFLGIMLLALAILFVPKGNVAFAQIQSEPGGHEDLIFAIYVDRQILSAGVFAVQHEGRYYLPVKQLAQVLDFSIDPNAPKGTVSGEIFSDDQSFFVDLNKEQIGFANRKTAIGKTAFLDPEIYNDDIYLSSELFAQIWPLELDIYLQSLAVQVVPDDKLPFQLALERAKRKKHLENNQDRVQQEDLSDLPFVAKPYELYGKPALDVSTSAGFNGVQDQAEYRISATGRNDLAYASADYSLSFAEIGGRLNKPENLRLRFRRQNIHEGALPLGLEDVQWGDVGVATRSLISNSVGGRGITFTTKENIFKNQFDQITVEGIGTPGWEVEVYRNDSLVAFSEVDERGEYRFEDVSISYGNNKIRVVLYGPQGQVREKEENYFYQSNRAKSGETIVAGGIVDGQKDLIPFDERESNKVKGIAANLYGAYGVNERLAVFASGSRLRDRDDVNGGNLTKQYITAGALTTFLNTSTQLELYKEVGGGEALDLRTLSNFKGLRVNSQASVYNDFDSPVTVQNQDVEFGLDVDKTIATPIGSIGTRASFDYSNLENGDNNTRYGLRNSLGVGRTRVTNNLTTSLGNGHHRSTVGNVASTTRIKGWRWRNNLNYSIFPEWDLFSIQTSLNYTKNRDYSTSFTVSRNLNNQATNVALQISKDFEKFLGGVQANWSSETGASLLLRASAGIGPFGPDGSYIVQSEPLRNVGPVASFVYNDNDYDGTYSEGDEPLPGARVAFNRRLAREDTDAFGNIYDLNVTTDRITAVTLNRASIDDPYLIPGVKGYQIYPRAGAVHRLEFPVIQTGAIDGTLRWSHNQGPIAGLVLQLMNGDAEIVKTSQTAPDGYFTFEHIVPGTYTIRADPASGLSIPFTYVDITPDDLFQFGTDISAVDLSEPNVNNDLGVGVTDDGLLSAKGILSIAKGFKTRLGEIGRSVLPSKREQPKNVLPDPVEAAPAIKQELETKPEAEPTAMMDADGAPMQQEEAAVKMPLQLGTYLQADENVLQDGEMQAVDVAPVERTVIEEEIAEVFEEDLKPIKTEHDPTFDGVFNPQGILSLARGVKERQVAMMDNVLSSDAQRRQDVNQVLEHISNISPYSGGTFVEDIRIGQHPDKTRIVLDLSAPVDYSMGASADTISIEMPFVNWEAQKDWTAKTAGILNDYHVEPSEKGMRLVLGVQDGVKVSSSGLLKAENGKKDRLYIDIAKN